MYEENIKVNFYLIMQFDSKTSISWAGNSLGGQQEMVSRVSGLYWETGCKDWVSGKNDKFEYKLIGLFSQVLSVAQQRDNRKETKGSRLPKKLTIGKIGTISGKNISTNKSV